MTQIKARAGHGFLGAGNARVARCRPKLGVRDKKQGGMHVERR